MRMIIALLAALAFAAAAPAAEPEKVGPPRDYYALYQSGIHPSAASYADGCKWAKADGRPLIVFVGLEPTFYPGCIVAAEDELPPLKPGVYVSWILNGQHKAEYAFKSAPTDDQVRNALRRYGLPVPAELGDGDCPCKRAGGGKRCDSYLCPSNGGRGGCPCEPVQPPPPAQAAPVFQPPLILRPGFGAGNCGPSG